MVQFPKAEFLHILDHICKYCAVWILWTANSSSSRTTQKNRFPLFSPDCEGLWLKSSGSKSESNRRKGLDSWATEGSVQSVCYPKHANTEMLTSSTKWVIWIVACENPPTKLFSASFHLILVLPSFLLICSHCVLLYTACKRQLLRSLSSSSPGRSVSEETTSEKIGWPEGIEFM